MRRWYVPAAVIGAAGLGMLFFSNRGRKAVRWAFENAHRAPGAFREWNETAQHELDRIQSALNRVAESLGASH